MKSAARLAVNFSGVLRRQRRKRGFSQEVLAERAGLHAVYVSMIERGARKPTLYVAALGRGTRRAPIEADQGSGTRFETAGVLGLVSLCPGTVKLELAGWAGTSDFPYGSGLELPELHHLRVWR